MLVIVRIGAVYLNSDHVIAIEPLEHGCVVSVIGPHGFAFDATAKEVAEFIVQSTASDTDGGIWIPEFPIAAPRPTTHEEE